MNTPTQHLTIITNEPSKVIVHGDSTKFLNTEHHVQVERSRDSLCITAVTDKNKKIVNVKSNNSFAYWLNLYPSILWTGFLIDRKSPQRYSYPRKIYIDIKSTRSNYLTYIPLDSTRSRYKNVLKFTPWKILALMNTGLEISFERKFSDYFTAQFAASYLLPYNGLDVNSRFKSNIRGFQVAVEEKLYFKKSAPTGPYVSVEFSYLRNKYKDIWNFGIKNLYLDTTFNYTNYPDTFGIKKQTYSINLKFGYQFFHKQVSFDLYAGLGIRYKDVKHFDRIKPEDEMEMPRHLNIYYITNLNGKYWTVSIPLNFRIGWTF